MKIKKLILSIFICSLMLVGVNNVCARILVVVPHPDDEALMFSGVVYSALSRGEPVKIVMMTNGDLTGVSMGNTRQDETVLAMSGVLGMQESDIIFLGYPDAGLSPIYNNYILSSDVYTAANGQSTTYGHRGLGSSDYHYYKFGSHATYNKPNILNDLEIIINDFLPDHIFVTSQYDQHLDHSTGYSFVHDTLTAISQYNSNYKPIIHQTIIHGGDDTLWPLTMNPSMDFTTPPILSSTPLNWSYRESIRLPIIMQDDIITKNLKYITILKYNSALALYGNPLNNYITSFTHKDEFFWADNIYGTNSPPVAHAGQDQTVSEGATVFLDGSASTDSNGTSLSCQWTQIQGTTVTLSNPTSSHPSFISPSGLSAASQLVFQLTVYDSQIYSFPDTVVVTVISNSQYSNVAPSASVAASSENSATGQLAIKAIDGVTSGCPSDCTKEWATVGQLTGAWINLSWPQSNIADKIVLFDRPSLTEQILNAALAFSDGSSITVGPLTNDGSGTVYTFPAKRFNSVKLTVNQANGSNAGLSEFQVFGNMAPSLAVRTPSLPAGAKNSAYSQTLAATGGQTPYIWSISTGTLPTGLTLNTSTGLISGTPTSTGTRTFTVQVKDANLVIANRSLTITINAQVAVSTTSLPVGFINSSYNQTLAATGGQTPYTWTILTGTLPAGLTINPSVGSISGIPTTAGTSPFISQVRDANQISATKSLTITIIAQVAVGTTSLAIGTTGTAYSQTLTATGGVMPYTWSIYTGVLPTGLTLNTSTGVISGTPTATGIRTFTVQVKDANLATASKSLTISIYTPLAVSTTSLANGTTGTVYSQTLSATGGLTPYTWSVSTGALPVGLTLNTLTGAISGTPTTGGTSSFTVRAQDANLTTAIKSLIITIVANQAPVASNDSYATSQNTGLTVTAPGVLANDTDAEGATLTAQLVSNPSHGTLSLSSNGSFVYTAVASYVGSDSFTYRANDGSTNSNTATVTVTITSTGNVIFADDFTRSVNPPAPLSPWTSRLGTWTVTPDVLNGSGAPMAYSHIYYAPTPLWDNYAVEGRFQFASSAFGGGLSCRVNPATGAQYSAWIFPDNSVVGPNVVQLVKQWDWTTYSGTAMAEASLPSVGTGWHTLKLVCNGNRIQVFYDGASKIDVTDNSYDSRAPYLSGGIDVGMGTFNSVYTMSADNVVVSTLAPVAANDTYSTNLNTVLTTAVPGVLANDTAPGGGALTAQLVTSPAHGTLTLNSNGSFTYTPTTGYSGSDSFTYRASDGTLTSPNAAVTITIDAAEHTVSRWKGNKAGAVSFTFDDGYLSQYSVGVTALNEQGYKGTFFVITDAINNNQPDMATWDNWRTAAGAGHEIGGHTKGHPYLTTLPTDQMREEILGSKAEIDTRISSQKTLSFAYPYGDMNDDVKNVTAGAYLVARGTTWGLNATLLDQYNLKAYFITDDTGKPLESQVDLAVSSGQWLVAGFHGLDGTDNGAVTEARFRQFIDYVKTKSIWVGTMGAVAKYAEEREHATLSVMSATGDGLVLNLSDGLDDDNYNEPLTIRSEVPVLCTSALVAQDAGSTRINAALEGTEKVIYYGATPDRGQITVTYNPPTVSTLTLNPGSVIGGGGSQGAITLDGPAPGGGVMIALSDNSAATTVPVSVTVPAGSTAVSFNITTIPVASAATATISATYGGLAKTASLTVNSPALSTLTVNPTNVKGGTSSQGTVTLSGAAPSGGVVVSLSDNSASASVPASVTVAGGSTSAVFTITTSTVLSDRTATVTAVYGGVQKTAILSITH
jgi:VCBS repeat-containing protein